MIRLGKNRSTVAAEVVAAVRRTAEYHTNIVGADPIVLLLPLDGDASCEYNPPGQTPWTFGPGVVLCSSTQGVMAVGSPEAFYGSPELEAKVGGFAIGDPGRGFSVAVRKGHVVQPREVKQA